MIRLTLIASLAVVSVVPLQPATQTVACPDVPFDEASLTEMVAGGVPANRLRALIATCGVDLRLPDGGDVESRLKTIGVPAPAVAALRPPPNPAVGATWVSPLDLQRMVFVTGGKLRMGSSSTESDRDADENLHDVTIPESFWIDVDEVTNAAFQRFIVSRPEWQKANAKPELVDPNYLTDWKGTSYPEGRGDAPVVWISWHAARAYALWAGKRLPTEAEWEHAARAGTSTRYWWGNEFEARRVATDSKEPASPEELQLRTNSWGVRDLLGDVWEWTSSRYRPYPYVSGDGREDTGAAGDRSIRGGARANGASFLRPANRSKETPSGVSDMLGFRCVR